jgi:hypothetical protein
MPFLVEVSTNLRDHGPIVRSAVVMLSQRIRTRSRKDIAAAGHFGRYAKGFNTSFKRISGGYVVETQLRPAFLKVKEYGGVSIGKPFLWIPKPPLRIKLRKYGGKLIRPKGKRVLIRPTDGEVMYIAIPSVTHRAVFHLRQIEKEETERFVVNMKEGIYSAKTQETVRFGG